ncbi:MAG: family 78 glycoside hydrolase catalytic domain [Armatimonadetes bacterium]|nr:family 78 glycoside hydrolase catalytic domain [Armatimonadota bacterium]
MFRATTLRVEYRDQPLGLDVAEPRLFWRVESDQRNDRQTAWQVQAASTLEALLAGQPDLWDSGRQSGAQTTHVPYGGERLVSRQVVWWRVQAWAVDGGASGWSEPVRFAMGLLAREDWQALAIGIAQPAPAELVREELTLLGCSWLWLPGTAAAEATEPGAVCFRRRLKLPMNRRVRHAEVLLTADPGFRLAVNGSAAGESDAPPDTWTRGKLLDITRLLGPGDNILAVEVVSGGGRAGLIGRLRVELEDGQLITEPIGPGWRVGTVTVGTWSAYGLDDYGWPEPANVGEYAQAPWQCHPFSLPAVPQPCPYLRRNFVVTGPVKRATAYVSALGLFELHLNGGKVSRDLLRPGWTDYAQRLPYCTYDVTAAIRPGENVLGALLAEGWYAGHLAFMHAHYGTDMRLIAQLEIEFEDGSRQVVATDGTWQARYGALLYGDLLAGEWYDARLELANWDQPGYHPVDWQPVNAEPLPDTRLVWSPAPPVHRQQEFKAVSVSQPKPGQYVFDLGQNLVGWAKLRIKAPAGTHVRLQFAEMLNPDGTLYLTNLRSARAIDTYVCRGGGLETWEPRFTFHGFRYVSVWGLPTAPPLDTVAGVAIHTDMAQTGSFECSEPMLNQLQHNIEWGQRGNYLEVPTDCPQRDERLGWTGDAQVFARTGCFNFDVAAFFTKWLADVADAQQPDGVICHVAPRTEIGGASAAWGDAIIVCPWTIYLCYGDQRILADYYEPMRRWLDWQTGTAPDHLRPAGGFGDWLQQDCNTPSEVIQTAWYAHGAALVAQVAQVLGRGEDAARYAALATDIRAAFQRAFVTDDGTIHGDTQCVYVLALAFDLLPEPQRPLAAARLAERLRERDVRISTGFVGTPYICAALADHGHLDLAYRLLLNDCYPSWGYSVKHGATTIWERWDGWTAEHGFQTPSMNSFNHYAYGAIGDWMYRVVAGLDSAEPGYGRLRIAPRPGGGLTYARAELVTPHGPAKAAWAIDDGQLTLDVVVPTNAAATVVVPTSAPDRVVTDAEPGAVPGTFEVGSGEWRFTAPV